LQYFYNGLNDESSQMIDSAARESLGGLTVDESFELVEHRASNDKQYNPDLCVEKEARYAHHTSGHHARG
jgi:hypothetical protein